MVPPTTASELAAFGLRRRRVLGGISPATSPPRSLIRPTNGRVSRLAYEEYDRALKQLLHLPVEESLNFPAEQSNLGPYVGYADLRVNDRREPVGPQVLHAAIELELRDGR